MAKVHTLFDRKRKAEKPAGRSISKPVGRGVSKATGRGVSKVGLILTYVYLSNVIIDPEKRSRYRSKSKYAQQSKKISRR